MKYYDKKLLRFLYELTKLKGFLSHNDIAKELKKRKFDISPKTVERWFKFLRGIYKYPRKTEHGRTEKFAIFNYFPNFFYEKLGLQRAYVLINPLKEEALKEYPFQRYNVYASWVYDSQKMKNVLLYGFAIPKEKITSLRKRWQSIKKLRKIKDYKILPVKTAFTINSTWHKTIDQRGVFHPEMNSSKEIGRQIKEFEAYLNKIPETKMIKEIKKNPLILPTIFEHHRKGWSSAKIWKYIKAKLGKEVWKYFKSNVKKTDNVGTRGVQKALQEIHQNEILHRMRLAYIPFELDNSFHIYSHLKFKNKEELLKATREIASQNIVCTVYPMEKNELFIISLLNHKALPKVLETFSEKNTERVLFLQHEKSLPLLTNDSFCIFDYASSFDPVNFRWKD